MYQRLGGHSAAGGSTQPVPKRFWASEESSLKPEKRCLFVPVAEAHERFGRETASWTKIDKNFNYRFSTPSFLLRCASRRNVADAASA